jgi:hypothetical protein
MTDDIKTKASSRFPYSTDWRRMAFDVKLVDPNDGNLTGPIARRTEHALMPVGRESLLFGWSRHALRTRLLQQDVTIQSWPQSRWDAADREFVARLPACRTADDVDAILPEKWRPHRPDVDGDPRLERFTRLCSSLVERVLRWTAPGTRHAPKSAAEWRKCEALQEAIRELLQTLGTAVGTTLDVGALKDEALLRDCWHNLNPDELNSIELSLAEHSSELFGGVGAAASAGDRSQSSSAAGRGASRSTRSARSGGAAAAGAAASATSSRRSSPAPAAGAAVRRVVRPVARSDNSVSASAMVSEVMFGAYAAGDENAAPAAVAAPRMHPAPDSLSDSFFQQYRR